MIAPVSLVITTYNRQRYLGSAIASILAQTYPDFELLLWDDGSTDRSLEIAQAYARKDARIRVVAAPHRGRVAALQAAIAQTQGPLLGWVDSDDLLAPTALAETVAILDRRPEVGWLYTDYVNIDPHHRITSYGRQCQMPYSPQRLLVDFITFHFRLVRRTLFDQVGGIADSPDFVEDYDLSLKLSEVAPPYHLPRPLYFYRHHGDNASVQWRGAQLQRAQRVVEQALQRRGLTDQLALSVVQNRFILRHKFRAIVPRGLGAGYCAPTGIFLATLPLLGLTAEAAQALVAPPPGQLERAHADREETPIALLPPVPDLAPPVPQFTEAPRLAQAITPANDGTQTVVTQQGNQFDITGGQTSSDQTNLFHSFEQFGLNADQIANFIARPEVQNILGRIVGGDPSVINGLLQVTGTGANLYLVNPAGILVGPDVQLNVPGALTLSTANALGFGDQWFNATGPNAYAALNGDPSQFAFTTAQPGAIVNTGNLTVGPGQAVRLLGGTVVNTGQISAAGGQIALVGVPGESVVRLSQPGHLLSLDISPSQLPTTGSLPVAALPQLLTGQGTLPGLTLTASGQVLLTTTQTVIPAGSGVTLATGSLDGSNPVGTGGAIALLGQRVGLFNASLEASGQTGGGQIWVGGAYQGQAGLPTASQTVVNGGTQMAADAIASGNGGLVILWGDDSTRFLGQISARGGSESGNGGLVEVSSPGWLDYRGQVDTTAAQGATGTLLLDPTNIEIVGSGYNTSNLDDVDEFIDPDLDTANLVTRLDVDAINFGFTDVTLQATNTITFNAEVVMAGFGYNLTAQAGNAILVNNDITLNGGTFTSDSGSFDATGTTITTQGGDIDIRTSSGSLITGDLDVSPRIFSGEFGPPFSAGDSGSVTLESAATLVTGNINASPFNPIEPVEGGPVTLTATGDITTGNIATGSSTGTGGPITLTSTGGGLTTGDLDATGSTQGGQVTGVAQSRITTGTIATRSSAGRGGNVTLDPAGDVVVGFIDAQGSTIGGNVDITTQSFFRATQTFIDQNSIVASISTAGGQQGGQVIIRHGGGLLDTPFTVGADFNGSNGTVGAITTVQANTISGGQYPTTYTQGTAPSDIQLITQNRPEPELPPVTELDPDPPPPFDPVDRLPPRTKTPIKSLDQARDILQQVEDATGIKPALVYVQFVPRSVQTGALAQDVTADPEGRFTNRETGLTQGFEAYLALPDEATQAPVVYPTDDDQLELMVITAQGAPIWKRIEVSRSQVLATAQKFRLEVADPRKTRTASYLPPAQDLYQWVIAPIQAELAARGIGNLTFLPDPGLRSVPWAALHNGSGFLIEQYSVGLMPSLSLADTRYVDIRNAQVLAMGASQFADQRPLPAVPLELQNLETLWQGRVLPQDQFTFENVRQLRQQTPYGIVHMATHGEFKAGSPADSYIQLNDTRLQLDQMRQLGWHDPPLELLVLSACRTALGDEAAELGFAGLAVQAGVKSALASLWYVSDVGTLALMTEFYRQLHEAPSATIKAEALRQAQLELLEQKVYLDKGQLLRGGQGQGIPISPEFSGTATTYLQHPYYWAAFTVIGSPW